MKTRSGVSVLACLVLSGSAMASDMATVDQRALYAYLEQDMPAMLDIEVTLEDGEIGAAYMEVRARSEGDGIIAAYGIVNGEERLLDSHSVGSLERAIRLDVGAALAQKEAIAEKAARLSIRTLGMASGGIGQVRLGLVAAGIVARVVAIAAPTMEPTNDGVGEARAAKRLAMKGEVPVVAPPSVSVWPNPFNPETRISLSLHGEAAVSVDIYDLRGQKVRSLLPESQLSSGVHDLTWRGDEDGGRKVASGVYLYVVKVGEHRFTGKLALLK